MSRPVRSLAEIESQERVSVRRIVFDGVRERCAELGLAEGDAVRVERRSGRGLVIRLSGRSGFDCPTELAQFIEVAGDDEP